MNLTLRNDYGCTEAIIEDNCGFDKFYRIADLLMEKIKVSFTNKIDDADTSYWDFTFKGRQLTLHYNIYNGVSIFPRNCQSAPPRDNEAVSELANILKSV